jgi:hypothetical protein
MANAAAVFAAARSVRLACQIEARAASAYVLLGRAAYSRFLLGLLPAGILHFALVKAHGVIVEG